MFLTTVSMSEDSLLPEVTHSHSKNLHKKWGWYLDHEFSKSHNLTKKDKKKKHKNTVQLI